MRGKRARVLAGKLSPSSRPLYGYQWADDARSRYAINPTTGPIVRRIFAECAQGRTLRAIARMLYDEGIPSAKGGVWDYVTVRGILRNPAYKGEAYAFRTKMVKEPGSNKKRKVTLPPEEWIPLPDGTIPPLVDAVTFLAAQRRLTLNQQRAPRNSHDPEAYLLRGGYIKCGHCGWSVTTRRIKGDLYYGCRKGPRTTGSCHQPTISSRMLDNAVWSSIVQVLTDPTVIERELRRLLRDDATEADVDAVQRALAVVMRQQGNLIDRLADIEDETIAEVVKQKLTALSQQRRQLEQERDAILGRRAGWEAAQASLLNVQAYCRSVVMNLDELTYAQKRLALDALNVQVHIFTRDHSPRYIITAAIPLDAEDADSNPAHNCVMHHSRRSCGSGRPSHCRPS